MGAILHINSLIQYLVPLLLQSFLRDVTRLDISTVKPRIQKATFSHLSLQCFSYLALVSFLESTRKISYNKMALAIFTHMGMLPILVKDMH